MSEYMGACSEASVDDLDKFGGNYSDQMLMARKYCVGCPISSKCLAEAMAHPARAHGYVWGGYTTTQREKLANGVQVSPPTPLGWKPPKRVSRYRGVHVHAKKWWRAEIKVKGKVHHLGRWPLTDEGEQEAARAYDQAAWLHFGHKATLNFDPPEGEHDGEPIHQGTTQRTNVDF